MVEIWPIGRLQVGACKLMTSRRVPTQRMNYEVSSSGRLGWRSFVTDRLIRPSEKFSELRENDVLSKLTKIVVSGIFWSSLN